MTPVTCMKGRNIAVFGLGGSGLVSARALLAGGARVRAWDDGEAARASAVAQGIAVVDLRQTDFAAFDYLVLSPGVPLTHPAPHWAAAKARAAGVAIIGDIGLFCLERMSLAPQAPFVAITGTNGKSTTTALIAHILQSDGRKVAMGGNIGIAVLDLPPPSPALVHVIECSSFQLDLAPFANPGIGILTNIAPDHLDRHGTMKKYAAIKARMIEWSDFAIVGVDDKFSRAIAEEDAMVQISARGPVANGVYFQDQALWRCVHGGKPERLASLEGIGTLRGAHNGQNAAAAVAAALQLEVALPVIAASLKTFPGLPHRMEEVARLGKTLFINDSKATNADSAEKALLSFEDIFWIIGGKAKDGGIGTLAPLFAKVRKAYLIGVASDAFARQLGDVAHEACGTLDVATKSAARDAAASACASPVVLLSPACASYDQFANFEVRGDRFRDLVRALPQA